jgi:hypothetical protein
MKILKILTLIFLTTTFTYAQVDCRPFLPNQEGAKWELTNYNAKGKEQGKIVYEVAKKTVSGNDITFTIIHTTFDKKGDEIYTGSYDAKCIDGVFNLDMKSRMDSAAMKGFKDMEVRVDASDFELPNLDAPAGTVLADGTLDVSMTSSALGFAMTVLIFDRKVEAAETIETPAGSFDCVVVSQKISTKMMIKVQAGSKEWYAENIGLVRTESYNKKGKLMGYSEITKIII